METLPIEITQNENALILTGIILSALAIFDIIMKGFAMYRAWTRRNPGRFICLLIFNTCWILPIIYLVTHEKIDN